jgi:uridine kinase
MTAGFHEQDGVENQSVGALLARVETCLAAGEAILLAIDGNSAAGKTTLASQLAERFQGQVFHMDDYFLQASQRTPERLAEPGGNVDRERFRTEVVEGLRSGEPFWVRAFDCASMALGKPRLIVPSRFTVVEGAYCLHPELRDCWTLTVFLSVKADIQSGRILARNGPERHKQFLDRWIPMEERYFQAFHVKASCDFVLDGSSLVLPPASA